MDQDQDRNQIGMERQTGALIPRHMASTIRANSVKMESIFQGLEIEGFQGLPAGQVEEAGNEATRLVLM